MTNHVIADVGCLLIGEYVDEAELPSNAEYHKGEAVRSQIVGDFVDIWGGNDGLKEFTVLLKDGRIVAVRGHSLKHAPHPIAGQDVYGIVIRNKREAAFIALFKSAEVAGIFHGDVQQDRKLA